MVFLGPQPEGSDRCRQREFRGPAKVKGPDTHGRFRDRARSVDPANIDAPILHLHGRGARWRGSVASERQQHRNIGIFSINGAGREERKRAGTGRQTMNPTQYAGARYIRVENLAGGPRRKIIANLELGQWDRPVLIFGDGSRLSLCATNVDRLIEGFGSTESEDLIDKEIELYTGAVKVQGGEKVIVLLRISRPPPSKSVKEDLDDEIPFSGLNWQRSGNRPLFQYGQEANES